MTRSEKPRLAILILPCLCSYVQDKCSYVQAEIFYGSTKASWRIDTCFSSKSARIYVLHLFKWTATLSRTRTLIGYERTPCSRQLTTHLFSFFLILVCDNIGKTSSHNSFSFGSSAHVLSNLSTPVSFCAVYCCHSLSRRMRGSMISPWVDMDSP